MKLRVLVFEGAVLLLSIGYGGKENGVRTTHRVCDSECVCVYVCVSRWCRYLGGRGAGLQLGAVGLDLLVQDVVHRRLLLHVRQVGPVAARLHLALWNGSPRSTTWVKVSGETETTHWTERQPTSFSSSRGAQPIFGIRSNTSALVYSSR